MDAAMMFAAMAASGQSNDPNRLFGNMLLVNNSVPSVAKLLVSNQAVTQAEQVGKADIARTLSTVSVRLLKLKRAGKVTLDSGKLLEELPGLATIFDSQEKALAQGTTVEAALVDLGVRVYTAAQPSLLALAASRPSAQYPGHVSPPPPPPKEEEPHEHDHPHTAKTVLDLCDKDPKFAAELTQFLKEIQLGPNGLSGVPYLKQIIDCVQASSHATVPPGSGVERSDLANVKKKSG